VLTRAASIAGGHRALAERLGVRLKELEKWIAGKASVPRDAFLRAVELILDDLAIEGDATDPGDPPPPRASSAWSPYDHD
jgi:hypothetical protein